MSSLVNKYIPQKEQYENNLFLEEYYSSTDTKISINDKDQTEISSINFSVQEQLKPIYGYNSRTWDQMSVGNRIVTGAFSMVIKNNANNSTTKEIIAFKRSNDESLKEKNDSYNQKENETVANTEWIGSSIADTVSKNGNSDLSLFGEKLGSLQFGVTKYSTQEDIKKAIRDYQISHFLPVTGVLTDETKNSINEEIKTESTYHDFTLPKDIDLFASPIESDSEKITRLVKGMSVKVNNDFDVEKWKIVKTTTLKGYANDIGGEL